MTPIFRPGLPKILARMSADEALAVLRAMDVRTRHGFARSWPQWAQPEQRPPPGDWRVWLLLGGRGFGKTRAGAEWVSDVARRHKGARIALVAATMDEARAIMVEGESGLLAIADPQWPPKFEPSLNRVTFSSGARATLFSADNPEGLRGAQHRFAWCDELGKWTQGGTAAWDNLMLGLRDGASQRVLATTTPRATPLLRRLLADPSVARSGGRTQANPYVAAAFVDSVERLYAGTRLGRQELDGELLEDAEGALWTRATIEGCRVDFVPADAGGAPTYSPPAFAGGAGGGSCSPLSSLSPSSPVSEEGRRTTPNPSSKCWRGISGDPSGTCSRGITSSNWKEIEFVRVVVAVDPPASATGDACGIVAAGLARDGIGYVVEDASVAGASPDRWARAVASCAARHGADRVIAEANNGGDMVRTTLLAHDPALPVSLVHASRGKGARAEPVAMLYEQGRVKHLAAFPELEDQLCGMTAGGYHGPGRSPDRADALVWALSELMLGQRVEPRIRVC